jgi:hypothetical protein
MQQNRWIWVVLAGVIVLAIGVYAYDTSHPAGVTANDSSASPYATSGTSPSDTSDAAIAKDTAAIDAQMNGVSNDNTAINESLGTATK